MIGKGIQNTEVVITATEETALKISVKPDLVLDKEYTSVLVEPYDYNKATNSAWIRETLLFDVDDITTRCELAEFIIEMYKMVASDPDIVQFSVKDAVPSIVRKEKIHEIRENLYDDISTDVDHIVKHREFFRTSGVIGITEEDCDYDAYNIINKTCTIVYLGYNENDEMVTNNPDKLNQAKWFVNSVNELSARLDNKEAGKIPPLVLVINPDVIEEGCTVLDKYFDPIDCVVCDTHIADDRTGCMLLSIAKRRGVMIVRGISAAGVYNFGNGSNTGSEDSKVGLINMDDELLTDDFNFLIRTDSRMTMLRDFIVTLNHRKNTEIILLKHAINDYDVRDLENYKVFPEWQTKQFSQIDQLSRGHVLHTPIAIMTQVPGIASMMVECGNFASCRAATINEYKGKVLEALKYVPPDDEDSDSDDDDDTVQKDLVNVLADKFERFEIQERNIKCLKQIQN